MGSPPPCHLDGRSGGGGLTSSQVRFPGAAPLDTSLCLCCCSCQALLLNGSLPEDEQEKRSYALCEQEACPEEQLVSGSVLFPSAVPFCRHLRGGDCVQAPLTNCTVLHAGHHPESAGPEHGGESGAEGERWPAGPGAG